MISAKMVKELRDKTGAGMVDCQKALKAANGDVELAIENLRKAGIAKAEKKSGRAATQGKVWTSISDKDAAIVELLIETDFAAKTPKFSDFVQVVANDARELDAEGDVTAQINEKMQQLLLTTSLSSVKTCSSVVLSVGLLMAAASSLVTITWMVA